MLNRLNFLLSEAWSSLRRNGTMTFAAITTSAVALFLVGGLGYAYHRVDQYARSLPSKFEMRVFLRDGTTQEQIEETQAAIERIAGVASVVHVPREEAWAKFKEDLGDAVPADLENPLPDAYTVVLSDLERSRSVASDIARMTTVAQDGVVYLGKEHDLIASAQRFLGILGAGLFVMLVPTTGILIYMAIVLAVHARRKEIRIMQLVGATKSTIAIPFLIEGTVQGAVGGAIAAPALYGVYRAISEMARPLLAGEDPTPFPLWPMTLLLVSAGAMFGLMCSWLAARKPLRLS